MARNALTPFGGAYGEWDPFLSLHREMNRLFDDVYRGGSGGRPDQGKTMFDARMDVSETENELRVCADLPGVDEKDVDITLDDNTLTIRGEKKVEQSRGDDKENYHFVERSYGTFQRSLRLPYAVNPDEVRADFKNGVLTITIPKSAQQQRSKRIQIGQGQASPSAQITDGERGGRMDSPPEQRVPQGEEPRAH